MAWVLTLAAVAGFSYSTCSYPPGGRAAAISFRQAVGWSLFYIAVALDFGVVLGARGWDLGLQYFAGYVVEKSLSIDNLFVFVIPGPPVRGTTISPPELAPRPSGRGGNSAPTRRAWTWRSRSCEIRRVLARSGGVALLNTVPDWDGTSWAHELGTLVTDARPEHPTSTAGHGSSSCARPMVSRTRGSFR